MDVHVVFGNVGTCVEPEFRVVSGGGLFGRKCSMGMATVEHGYGRAEYAVSTYMQSVSQLVDVWERIV